MTMTSMASMASFALNPRQDDKTTAAEKHGAMSMRLIVFVYAFVVKKVRFVGISI